MNLAISVAYARVSDAGDEPRETGQRSPSNAERELGIFFIYWEDRAGFRSFWGADELGRATYLGDATLALIEPV